MSQQSAETTPKSALLSKEIHDKLRESRTWARALQIQASCMDRRARWLSIPVVVLTAVTGTAIFANLGRTPHLGAEIAFGTATLAATVLSALQGNLKYRERAAEAKLFASEYEEISAVLKRAKEELKIGAEFDERILYGTFHRFDRARRKRPEVSDRIWDEAKRQIGHHKAAETA